jgi:hypothetical protein
MQTTQVLRRLGRTPRTFDPRVPHLSALLAGKVPPPPPPSADYTQGMGDSFGMMLNDTLGDCTCAAYYHARQVWTFHAGGEVTEPDSDVEELYVQACGYNPKTPGEGPGGNEQHVLTYLHKTGAPIGAGGAQRDKITAFVEVDPRNTDDVKRTIVDLGLVYIGFNVPQNIVPQGSPPPAVWTVAGDKPKIVGGHAVVLPGYDATGPIVISWGQKYSMTWDFFATYVDEVYGITDPAWTNATGRHMAGLTPEFLAAQMQYLA